jgi:hypothetical protein
LDTIDNVAWKMPISALLVLETLKEHLWDRRIGGLGGALLEQVIFAPVVRQGRCSLKRATRLLVTTELMGADRLEHLAADDSR